jgi:hypothetical protein
VLVAGLGSFAGFPAEFHRQLIQALVVQAALCDGIYIEGLCFRAAALSLV